MKLINSIVIISILTIGIFACEFQNEETLFPDDFVVNQIDTVSYSLDVVPLLESQCYECHDAGNGIVFDTYPQLLIFVENDDLLLRVIRHEPGVPAMPLGAPMLSVSQISLIEDWVEQGALDN